MRAIRTVCLLAILGILGPGLALGQENPPTAPAPAASPAIEPPANEPPAALPAPAPQPEAQPQALPEPQATAVSPASPALNLSQPPVAADKEEPLVEKWWFWSAIGAVVIGAVVAIVLVDTGSSTPRTTLGNQEFRP